jgi:hypothetical protein
MTFIQSSIGKRDLLNKYMFIDKKPPSSIGWGGVKMISLEFKKVYSIFSLFNSGLF